MNLQDELQKIHHQYGTSEKANYEIEKLFDKQLKAKIIDKLPSNRQIKETVKINLTITSVRFSESKVYYTVKFPCGEEIEIDSANF